MNKYSKNRRNLPVLRFFAGGGGGGGRGGGGAFIEVEGLEGGNDVGIGAASRFVGDGIDVGGAA